MSSYYYDPFREGVTIALVILNIFVLCQTMMIITTYSYGVTAAPVMAYQYCKSDQSKGKGGRVTKEAQDCSASGKRTRTQSVHFEEVEERV